MNSRVYPKNQFTREINSLRINLAKLSCPNCFSKDVYDDLNDSCTCRNCYSKFEFKNLLKFTEVRDKKLDTILQWG